MVMVTGRVSAPAIVTAPPVLSTTHIVEGAPHATAAVLSQPSTVSCATYMVPTGPSYPAAPCTVAPTSPLCSSMAQTIVEGSDMDYEVPVAVSYQPDILEPALPLWQAPSICGGSEWAYEDAFGAMPVEEQCTALVEKKYSSQDYAPVFLEQPQPQFVPEVATSAPPVVSSPQYIVYDYYGNVGGGFQSAVAPASPLLLPMSTYTASAPVLRHMSRTYTEEEYLTESSTADSCSEPAYARTDAGSAAATSYLTSTGAASYLTSMAAASMFERPAIPTRKPAYLEQRLLLPRDPQVRVSY
ncbi:hypothetical protein V5799_013215 [Amblyomma americanum]|uniref:Uncharacterized protein n=1 Tax=Amblyomma americanum TaxID=6943 RepID=A0AAQ4E6L4_AMBAM